MAIEVRCGCGQLVYADPGQAGQVVGCPHCKGGVPVPVATAASAPPDPGQAARDQAVGTLVVGTLVLVGLWACSEWLGGPAVKWAARAAVMAMLLALGAFRSGR